MPNLLDTGPIDPTKLPLIAASASSPQLTANATIMLFQVPGNMGGMYFPHIVIDVVTAAGTSSTLPQVNLTWTDLDSGVQQTQALTNTLATNGQGNHGQKSVFGFQDINIKAGTLVTIATSGYASSGAPVMAYVCHAKLVYLGPTQ